MNEEKELGGSLFRCPLYDEDISKEDCDSTVQLIKNGRVPRGGEGEWLTEKDVTERSAICLKCPHNENMLFERALNHVIACQSGQIQWGTGRPAVLLALEALQVLQSMRADVPLLIGGLMYSGDVGTEEIEDLFGAEILQLVAPYDLAPEEDHLKAWEASQKAIRESDHRHKLIVLADLVAALRALWRDVEELGDAVWERFQFPMEDLSWYYSGLMDALDNAGIPAVGVSPSKFGYDILETYDQWIALLSQIFPESSKSEEISAYSQEVYDRIQAVVTDIPEEEQ